MNATDFAPEVLAWHMKHGRHDLPWTLPRSPYNVWLSEIMLQQTQVSTVLGYFPRFIAALPDVVALAHADEDTVLALWTGLGYYSRARNLHAAAKRCVESHAGEIPNNFEALLELPGVGRSTAGAIMAQAFDARYPILDGNVKRVLARISGEREWTGLPAVEKRLWALAEQVLPVRQLADYTQAMMDLGATVCTRTKPACINCPVQKFCCAFAEGTTDAIPAPRPKKAIPVRTCAVLWLQNAAGLHLLEKRPAKGIWASLWSLPQFEHTSDADAWLASLDLTAEPERIQVQHTFTHFKLNIEVLHVRTGQHPFALPENARWVDDATLQSLGIPAPIRTLLESKK